MSDQRITLTLRNPQQGWQEVTKAWQWAKAMLIAGHRLHLSLRKETRKLAQNSLMWSCLTDLSRQVEWPVDGRMSRLEPEDWKDILSAGLKKTQRVAQGIEGGFVMLGQRTSEMTIAEMSELIDLAHAFGDERGVRWSPTSLGREWAAMQEVPA